MGLLSNLKNSLTGGWADVAIDHGEGRRGEPLAVTVHVAVRSSAIEVSDVYLRLECHEIVEIDNHRVSDRDADGGLEVDHVDIRRDERLFERRVSLARGVSMDAESQQAYETQIELPAHLPPTYTGRHARIRWRALAALDMKGNDPDSGWQEIPVS